MKKLLTLALTFCAFIVAMACGSNEPEVDGTTGATEQSGSEEGTAKGKMLVVYFSRADENWLKKLGVDKQSTAINNVRTRSVDNSVSYSLNGMRSSGQRGIQIRNGNKYIKQP